MKEIIEKNKIWGKKRTPFITVITPVFNRRRTIWRTIKSIEKQTFRDIEYIVIDDGSTEPIDDIVHDYMSSTELPVMFIKKQNGGVHTARNAGYRHARGELVLCIDSDDELTPDACQIFHDAWMAIPDKDKSAFQQIKAQCVDQDGQMGGPLFPDGINELPNDVARKYFMTKGERIGCHVTKIMKENLYPEPKGVTLVSEGVRLVELEQRYRSWAINDVVRIWHREGNDHLSKKWDGEKQHARNMLWSRAYMLNRHEIFYPSFLKYFINLIKYSIFEQTLLKCGDTKFVEDNKLFGIGNNFWRVILKPPTAIYVIMMNLNLTKKNKSDIIV